MMPFNLATTTSSLDPVIYASHAYVWPPLYVVWGNKWPLFWLTHWPKCSILVNTQQGGLCGGHRSLHVDNQVPRTSVCVQLAYLGTLRSEPRESSIKLREYDRFKGFNGTVELQWPSMVSMGLKGFKAIKEIQRPSKVGEAF